MTKPTVLLVCVHNAGRSQLAAGLAAHHAGGQVKVLSAGTEPDQQVDPIALASLAELGIDRSDQVPTQLTEHLAARSPRRPRPARSWPTSTTSARIRNHCS